jgi:hypothetical protein
VDEQLIFQNHDEQELDGLATRSGKGLVKGFIFHNANEV